MKARAEVQAGIQASQVDRVKQLEAELTQSRNAAREEAAKLAGQAQVMTAQQAELMAVLKERDNPKGGKK